jgi:hypothetical protein
MDRGEVGAGFVWHKEEQRGVSRGARLLWR